MKRLITWLFTLDQGAIENMGTYDDLTKLENSLLLPKQQEGSGDDSKDELAIPNVSIRHTTILLYYLRKL